jgi:uncharacterized protein YkwD
MVRLPSSVYRLPALVLLLAASDEFQATREAFVESINEVRAASGVHAVRLSAPLTSVAQARAKEIAAGGRGPQAAAEEDSRRLAKAGYETRIVSEVEAQADGDVDEVIAAWREDKGGRGKGDHDSRW